MFKRREVLPAAQIRALVRTIVEWTRREPHFAPQEATSCGFYELECIENLSILCDSTMDFHDEVQLLTTLAPSSLRVRSQTKYLGLSEARAAFIFQVFISSR